MARRESFPLHPPPSPDLPPPHPGADVPPPPERFSAEKEKLRTIKGEVEQLEVHGVKEIKELASNLLFRLSEVETELERLVGSADPAVDAEAAVLLREVEESAAALRAEVRRVYPEETKKNLRGNFETQFRVEIKAGSDDIVLIDTYDSSEKAVADIISELESEINKLTDFPLSTAEEVQVFQDWYAEKVALLKAEKAAKAAAGPAPIAPEAPPVPPPEAAEAAAEVEEPTPEVPPEVLADLIGADRAKAIVGLYALGEEGDVPKRLEKLFDRLTPAQEKILTDLGFASVKKFQEKWKAELAPRMAESLAATMLQTIENLINSDPKLRQLKEQGTLTQRAMRGAFNLLPTVTAGAATAGLLLATAGTGAPVALAGAGFIAKITHRFFRSGNKKAEEERREKNKEYIDKKARAQFQKVAAAEGDLILGAAMSTAVAESTPPENETAEDKILRTLTRNVELTKKIAKLAKAKANAPGATEADKQNALGKRTEATLAYLRLENEKARQDFAGTPELVEKKSFWNEAMEAMKRSGTSKDLWLHDKDWKKRAAGYAIEGAGGAAAGYAIGLAGANVWLKAAARSAIGLASGGAEQMLKDYSREIKELEKLNEYISELEKDTTPAGKARVKELKAQLEKILPKQSKDMTAQDRLISALKGGLKRAAFTVALGSLTDTARGEWQEFMRLKGLKDQTELLESLENKGHRPTFVKLAGGAGAASAPEQHPPAPVAEIDPEKLTKTKFTDLLKERAGYDTLVHQGKGITHPIVEDLKAHPNHLEQYKDVKGMEDIIKHHEAGNKLSEVELKRAAWLIYKHDVHNTDLLVDEKDKLAVIFNEKEGRYQLASLDKNSVEDHLYTEKTKGGPPPLDKKLRSEAMKDMIESNPKVLDKVLTDSEIQKFEKSGTTPELLKEAEKMRQHILANGVMRDYWANKLAGALPGSPERALYEQQMAHHQAWLNQQDLALHGRGEVNTRTGQFELIPDEKGDTIPPTVTDPVLQSLHVPRPGEYGGLAEEMTGSGTGKELDAHVKEMADKMQPGEKVLFKGHLPESSKISDRAEMMNAAGGGKGAAEEAAGAKSADHAPAPEAKGGGGKALLGEIKSTTTATAAVEGPAEAVMTPAEARAALTKTVETLRTYLDKGYGHGAKSDVKILATGADLKYSAALVATVEDKLKDMLASGPTKAAEALAVIKFDEQTKGADIAAKVNELLGKALDFNQQALLAPLEGRGHVTVDGAHLFKFSGPYGQEYLFALNPDKGVTFTDRGGNLIAHHGGDEQIIQVDFSGKKPVIVGLEDLLGEAE